MNRGKVVAGDRALSPEGKKGTPFWVYVVFGLLLLALGIGLVACSGQSSESSPATGSSGVTGPLGIAVVGQPAPGFSLMDQYEQPYTLNPGDGKNHLLVFYMGYF